jgi:hypothetical protein
VLPSWDVFTYLQSLALGLAFLTMLSGVPFLSSDDLWDVPGALTFKPSPFFHMFVSTFFSLAASKIVRRS